MLSGLKQKSKTKRKKKIATAIYEYQADCDGEWGEISFDFENGTAEISPTCRLGYNENKPLCEQGNSLPSKLRKREVAKGNDSSV